MTRAHRRVHVVVWGALLIGVVVAAVVLTGCGA